MIGFYVFLIIQVLSRDELTCLLHLPSTLTESRDDNSILQFLIDGHLQKSLDLKSDGSTQTANEPIGLLGI